MNPSLPSIVWMFSTNISSPGWNGKLPPWLKNPLPPPESGSGALKFKVTVLLLSIDAPVTTIPFELIVGIIRRSSDNPLSLVKIWRLLTEVPFKVAWATIFGFPTAITFGGLV